MTQSMSPLLMLMDKQWEMASRFLRRHPDQEWVPQFLTETANERAVFVVPWRSDADKTTAIVLLGLHFREMGVKRYVLSSEVWMAQYEGKPGDDFVMPRERPDRKECLMILGVDPDAGEVLQYFAEIKHEKGRRRLGERESLPYGGFEGRMTELLGPIAKRTVN